MIDILPQKIEVKDSSIWKKKDMSKVKDFKQIEIISDWTYSVPYKGGVHKLSTYSEEVHKVTGLTLPKPESASKLSIKRDSETGIPYERLGRENPIVHFGEIYLFEDDLGDQGYTCLSLRFRVMKDCFYVLVRYYLRVDEVLVRIYDTRIFHGYETNYIIREF